MSRKRFANRGQVIQVVLTAIALGVAVIVSLPVLKQHQELLDFLQFILLLLALYGCIFRSNLVGTGGFVLAKEKQLVTDKRQRCLAGRSCDPTVAQTLCFPSGSPLLVRMYPNLRHDPARLGQPDHVHPWRPAPLIRLTNQA
jgi:hypothetical protein